MRSKRLVSVSWLATTSFTAWELGRHMNAQQGTHEDTYPKKNTDGSKDCFSR